MTFINLAIEQVLEKSNFLLKIEKLVDWEKLIVILENGLGKRNANVVGKEAYDILQMFKIMLLQRWHNLSDPKMEDALRTRIDFMWFTGFCLSSNKFQVPDETTICRFRNALIQANIMDNLLCEINRQLEDQHLKINIKTPAICYACPDIQLNNII